MLRRASFRPRRTRDRLLLPLTPQRLGAKSFAHRVAAMEMTEPVRAAVESAVLCWLATVDAVHGHGKVPTGGQVRSPLVAK